MVDYNLHEMRKDVSVLHGLLPSGFIIRSEKEAETEEIARRYFVSNEAILQAAIDAFEHIPVDRSYESQWSFMRSQPKGILRSSKEGGKIDAYGVENTGRMLKFAEKVADTSDFVLQMHPIEAFLERKIRGTARLVKDRVHDYYNAHIFVEGGLTKENRQAFEDVEFPNFGSYENAWGLIAPRRPLQKVATIAIPIPGYTPEQTATEPYISHILVPVETKSVFVETLRKAGFNVNVEEQRQW